VGLIEKSQHIINLLQHAPIVGLVGMGGIGKTTLSKKVYHLLYGDYKKCSFLEDVAPKRIVDVKRQLFQDLCGTKISMNGEPNENDMEKVKHCMITKKVLVIIDNVGHDTLDGLGALIINDHNKRCESKVIMNCRNWQFLRHYVKEEWKMNMEFLKEDQATKLFMIHAFPGANNIANGFQTISKEIVKACDGLPLSLKVMGSLLCNEKNLEVWQDALCTLRRGDALEGGHDNEILWKKLELCYTKLQEKEKNMFLDIACFFNGMKVDTAIFIWRSQWKGVILGLQNLKFRSLIKIQQDGSLAMHQQLQDMGRKIAREQESCISNFEEAKELLQNKKAINMVIAILYWICLCFFIFNYFLDVQFVFM